MKTGVLFLLIVAASGTGGWVMGAKHERSLVANPSNTSQVSDAQKEDIAAMKRFMAADPDPFAKNSAPSNSAPTPASEK